MTMKVPKPVLNLPRNSDKLVGRMQTICHGIKGNVAFQDPTPSMDVVELHIDTLNKAEINAGFRTKGAAALRDAAKNQVISDGHQLCAYVQSVALKCSSLTEARAVIESAHMTLKKTSYSPAPELLVKNSDVHGQVTLIAKSAGRRATYYWEHSSNQIDWLAAPETVRARTTISGLPLLAQHYFRFCTLTVSGKGDYSQVVSLLVL